MERESVEGRDATSLSVDGCILAAGPLAVTADVDDGGSTGGRVSVATAEDGSDDEEEYWNSRSQPAVVVESW